MEDVDFGFYVTLFLTCLLFILVPLKMAAARKLSKLNLPPGPWKLPVIGNLHQIAHSLPHHRLRDLAREHGDLMYLQLGELSHVIISSAEVAREMMRTHDANFAQRPFFLAAKYYDYKNIAFAPYGHYWRQLRKICTQELLSPARVRSFRSIREEEVSALIEQLHSASGMPVNLTEKFYALTYAITAKAAFGKKCRQQEAFIATVKEGQKRAGGFSIAELFPSQNWLQWVTGFWPILEKRLKGIDEILQEIIDNCRADREVSKAAESSGRNSLLDALLDVQEKGDLTIQLENQNLRAIVLDVFGGGSDTTSTALEWAMYELSRHPTAMEMAQAEVRRVFGGEGKIDEARLHELTYLNFVIKETLRLHPPAPLLVPRESRESCVINGYNIPAKTKVLVNAWAIARDPRYWREPDIFKPERFLNSEIDFKGTDFELIPFGAGRRMCPGMSFAIADLELPLAHMLFHFDWELPNGIGGHDNADAIEYFGVTVHPKDDIYLIPVPRSGTPTSM